MNTVNKVGGVLFPLITFPYISRILEPQGLGKVTFAQAVVGYFAIIAAAGIPLYGIREAAKVRDDKRKLSQLAVELFLLNVIITVLAFAAFAIFMAFSKKAGADPLLFWLCGVPMLLGPVGFDWLFSGLEEFTFVAVRTLAFRIIALIAIFIFVRTALDFRVYAFIIGMNATGGNLINLFFARRYLATGQVNLRELRIWKHVKPVLLVFSMGAMVSVYTSLDKVMLGYLSNDVQVGYYAIADKIVKVAVMLVTALGAVMLPRASYQLQNNQHAEYGRLANFSLRAVCLMCFPAAFGLVAMAHPFILTFSGGAFAGSAIPLELMGINITFIAVSNFIGFQVLYPQNKENLLVLSVFVGALINFGLNWLLIPRWQAIGAAVATLVAECSVTAIQVIISRPYYRFAWPKKEMLQYGIAGVLMAVVIHLAAPMLENVYLQTIVCIPLGALIYMAGLVLARDEVTFQFLGKLSAVGTRRNSTGN